MSIFDFLKADFKTLYLFAVSMEKLLKSKDYNLACLTAKVISDFILKELSGGDLNYKTTIPKLTRQNAFGNSDSKNSSTANKHLTVQISLFKIIHKNHTLKNPKILHELVFDILIEYYNTKRPPISLKYSYNIKHYEYSENPLYPDYEFITKDELDSIFYNFCEKTVYKNDLIKHIEAQREILTKFRVRNLLKIHEEDVVNKNELDEFLNGKYSFLTGDDVAYISENFYENTLDADDFTEEADKLEIISAISSFNDDVITTDELYLDKYQHILKEAIEDLIRIRLSEFLNAYILGIYTTDYALEQNPTLRRYGVYPNEDGFSFMEMKGFVNLDRYQLEAIGYDGEKPLVIDAGPGAGKTKVIIERVVHLINERGAKASSILVITFTAKAADELKQRFKTDTDLSADVISQMRISTIHSFCRYVLDSFDKNPKNYLDRNGEKGLFLQKHRGELEFTREAFLYNFQMPHAYSKYDEYNTFGVDAEGLVKYIEKERPVGKDYLDYIDTFYKNNPEWMMPSQAEIEDMGYGTDLYNARYLQIAKSYPKYRQIMEREDVADHELLLIKTLEFFKKNPQCFTSIPFKNILIDEFQDTDPIQMQIFEKLLEECETFTVVGDVDQSIYGFRGSYTTFFTNFANNAKYELIQLKYNYRSSRNIVEFNEKLIENDREIDKELTFTKGFKNPVFNIENSDEYEQAINIAKIITHLKENNKIEKYSDIAILFRSRNSKIDAITEKLEESGIPFYLKDQNDLINQDETKAIIVLFWYISHENSPFIYDYNERTWISLMAFADVNFNSNRIFDLSPDTINAIRNIESGYRKSLLDEEMTLTDAKSSSYTTLLKQKRSLLSEIFKKHPKPDLSTLTKAELVSMGIADEHDLEFFTKLNEIKRTVKNPDIPSYEKPTTLEIYFKLLEITGYLEKLLSRNDHESTKALMNLALISEIIDDYENIIGRHDINGLYDYLKRIIKTYSCPVHETEDTSDKVHVMTAHSSKGLEYPVIILTSLQERSFPRVFSESFQKQDYIANKPTYYTPRQYLKYKPDSLEEEERQYNQEEKRIMYVASTRAEELLILSSLPNRKILKPSALSNTSRYYESLSVTGLDKISKVKSRQRFKGEQPARQIIFEDIINDYLFCPLKYMLKNDYGYRSNRNNSKFIEKIIKKVFSLLHNPDTVIEESDLDDIFSSLIRSYDLERSKDFDEFTALFESIRKYWHDTGRHLDICDFNVSLTENFDKTDLQAKLDLLILNEDGSVSIMKFIHCDESVKNYIAHYMNNLNYYGKLLNSHPDYKDLKIKKVILYSLKNNEMTEKEYDGDKNDFIQKVIINIIQNITDKNMARYTVHCRKCEFDGIICNHDPV